MGSAAHLLKNPGVKSSMECSLPTGMCKKWLELVQEFKQYGAAR